MKKKFLAAILAAAVMVTSIQLPPMEVRAEETDALSEYDTVFENEGLYKTGEPAVAELWETFETAYKAAKAAGNEATSEQLTALSAAKEALDTDANKRTIEYRKATENGDNYTTPSQEVQQGTDIYQVDDEFHFPELGESKILEMEYLELVNGDTTGWDLQVVEAPTSSNGFKVSGLDQSDDRMYLYYTAPRTGVYRVEYKYYSGKDSNSFTLAGTKIDFGNGNFRDNGQWDEDGTTQYTGTFEFEVTTSGAGMIEVVPGSDKAPTLDVMTITAKEVDLNVEITADPRGDISGDAVVRQNASEEYTITPNEGYQVKRVVVNGDAVALNVVAPANSTTGASYTFTVIGGNEDITIVPEYDYFNYSEDNRFEFPTEKGQSVTLEMEYLVLNNNSEGDVGRDGQEYPLTVSEGDRNGTKFKFLNSLNNNDEAVLYYNAERQGTYSAVVTYRSGKSTNALRWSEANNQIQEDMITSGVDDYPLEHELSFTFTVESAGEGVLTFTGAGDNAPQLDKIVITADPLTYTVAKNAGEHGTITGNVTVTEGEDATFTITPETGYVVEEVKVNGNVYDNVPEAGGDVTVSNVSSNITIEAKFEKEAYVAGYNAVLEDNILMKFHMKLSQAVIDQEPKVVIGLDGSEPKELALSDGTPEGDYYVFEYGVPAKDMRTNINVQVVSADGDKTFFTGVYTVAGYTADLKEEEPENAKIEKLVDAMLEFGDYAKTYFAEGTPEEGTAAAPELWDEDYMDDLETKKAVIDGVIANNYYGSSLLLKENTIIRHYFKADITKVPDGYEEGEKDGFYYIESEGIAAHELDKEVPITVTTVLGEVEITYSPLSYAQSALSSNDIDDELQNVMRAMYLYHKAAQDYLGEETNE